MPSLREETCTDTSDEEIDVTLKFLTSGIKLDLPTNVELVAHEDCVGY